jgi:hypothetical protein
MESGDFVKYIIEDEIIENEFEIEDEMCDHLKFAESDFESEAVHKFNGIYIISKPTRAFFNCLDCGEGFSMFVAGGAFNIPIIK